MIEGKKIVLGITGSIAAYKSIELLRKLQKMGAEVRVATTPSALKFVSKLTLQILSGSPVYFDNLDETVTFVQHTSLASWGDLFLVAPATANTIAKISCGIADNPVTELALCFGKGIICPAMNSRMYKNLTTQENLEKLKKLGYEVVEPEEGFLACKDKGRGRLADLDDILDAVFYWFLPKLFEGKKVVITAGATREYIDPVRFISNPSSGKMGFALAKVFKGLGAEVVLITGKTHLRAPYKVKRVDIETVKELKEAVMEEVKDADLYISAAAIGDFRPIEPKKEKIKKTKEKLILELERTEDILKIVSENRRNGQVIVGFAAETKDLVENARKKIENKKLDAVVANDVKKGIFGSDKTDVLFITKDTTENLVGSKEEVALEIAKSIFKKFFERR
jgi:phosphopantothenoylcysteine decarboxylase/phosphopantothenate--cysteine ligase